MTITELRKEKDRASRETTRREREILEENE